MPSQLFKIIAFKITYCHRALNLASLDLTFSVSGALEEYEKQFTFTKHSPHNNALRGFH